ncbi:hypothetical protein [Luteibacter sp. RCC_6_2]|jgi:hypothetical protein|uniref:hypothetical protein n=1 Tax=Luteibacter sp. RCC_6_2 TaxID=3239223 RepID=UPI0035234ADD
MKFHMASAAIAIVISTTVHSSPQAPAGVASNIFPKAGHYGGMTVPEGPLATILPKLKKQARAGDPAAYASVYAGLSRCRALRAYGPEETAIEYCSGVPESDIADAGAWLSTAADKGDERAMYVFSIAGAQELRTIDITARSKSARFDYRSRALTYLTTLAGRCNVDAMDAIYRQKISGGDLFGKDIPGANLLQRELIVLYPGLISLDERVAVASQISPSEVMHADAEADIFLNSRCR